MDKAAQIPYLTGTINPPTRYVLGDREVVVTDAEKIAEIRPLLRLMFQGPPVDWPGRTEGEARWEMCAWTARHVAELINIVESA